MHEVCSSRIAQAHSVYIRHFAVLLDTFSQLGHVGRDCENETLAHDHQHPHSQFEYVRLFIWCGLSLSVHIEYIDHKRTGNVQLVLVQVSLQHQAILLFMFGWLFAHDHLVIELNTHIDFARFGEILCHQSSVYLRTSHSKQAIHLLLVHFFHMVHFDFG